MSDGGAAVLFASPLPSQLLKPKTIDPRRNLERSGLNVAAIENIDLN